MAFGDILKEDVAEQNSTTTFTTPPDLGSNPTSGNLLVCVGGSGELDLAASGMQTGSDAETTDAGNDDSSTVFYQISSGTEQTQNLTHTSGALMAWYAEVEGPWEPEISVLDLTAAKEELATTAYETGSAGTTAQADEFVVIHGIHRSHATNRFTAWAINGTATVGTITEQTDSPGTGIGSKTLGVATCVQTAAGTIEGAATLANSVDGAIGISTFKKQAAGGGDPEAALIGGKLLDGGMLTAGGNLVGR